MKYELWIGLRYTRAKKRNSDGGSGSGNGFISFISLISTLGIGLGVAALIVVLSVMNGFQKELRTRILGVASHIQINGSPRNNGELTDWSLIAQEALRHPKVRAAAPFVQEQGMLSYDQEVRGVGVRGVLPEAEEKVADFEKHMKSGHLADLPKFLK